jgi:metal-responsive CopG/Arc/MetJ family transcriptional regulator
MSIAVSVPDEVLESVDRLAKRAGRSRSDVVSAALQEYVARHRSPDDITKAMNEVCEKLDQQDDGFVAAASRRILENVEW